MSDTRDKNSQELAKDRTDWAEDRTVLANERTFAGWMRTGLAAVGMGLAVQAIFKAAEPTWLAKAAATGFILIGVGIFFTAYRSSCALLERLSANEVEPASTNYMGLTAASFIAGSTALAVILWLL